MFVYPDEQLTLSQKLQFEKAEKYVQVFMAASSIHNTLRIGLISEEEINSGLKIEKLFGGAKEISYHICYKDGSEFTGTVNSLGQPLKGTLVKGDVTDEGVFENGHLLEGTRTETKK